MAALASETARRRPGWPGMVVTLVLAGVLIGCDGWSAGPPATLEGAWLGEGIFRTRAGNADVKAQLELLSDGTYRLLMLEPAMMALTGVETGGWSREGQTLTLTPGPFEPEPSGSVFQQLRRGDAEATRPPRTLAIATDLTDLRFDDGQLALTFTPNADATAKLREAGQVAAP